MEGLEQICSFEHVFLSFLKDYKRLLPKPKEPFSSHFIDVNLGSICLGFRPGGLDVLLEGGSELEKFLIKGCLSYRF